MDRLNGKVALITGAGGGIGAATARAFVAEGARVVLTDLDGEPLRALAAALGDAAVAVPGDVTDPATAPAAVAEAVARFGGLDVLFANAGTEGKVAPLAHQARADFEAVLAVNVIGPWLCVQAAAPAIAARGGGSIVITSSVAGLVGSAGLGPYVASKHAVIGLAQVAALELAAQKIRVNTVNPGPIENRMMRSIEQMAAPGAPEAVKAGFERVVPLGRYGTNEEIARLALFLASDESSYCTGNVFVADGGFVTG
jgi:NAD(P)-dependent dehydrogenase (short-subunit alcohol dehydrogenase family)